MLKRLTEKLMPIADNAMAFFGYMQQHQLLLALLSGLTLPFIIPLKRDEHEKAPLWKRIIICLSLLCFIFGTLSPATSYVLGFLYPAKWEITTPVMLWAILILFTLLGVIFHYVARRILTPEIDKLKRRLVKKPAWSARPAPM